MIRDLSICPTARAVLEGSDADAGEAPVKKRFFVFSGIVSVVPRGCPIEQSIQG